MTENNKAEVVKHLSHCSDAELREILFAVFQNRKPNPEEDGYNKNCFFLGTASSLLESSEGEPERWGAYEIEAVAYVDRGEYGETLAEPDWGFCQFGECGQCGVSVRSNFKHGVCPVCGSRVHMT